MSRPLWHSLVPYALTGMTGLAYEVLWVRMIGTEFGASQFGVVVTVCAFMLGLGLGALAGFRLAVRIIRPLLVFAVLEALIGLHALALPFIVSKLGPLLMMAGSTLSPPAWTAIEVLATVAALMLPAMAMGAAFPVILMAGDSEGRHLGTFYGVNACGAALGALLPLILLPLFGWAQALQSMAALSLAIAFVTGCLGIHRPREEHDVIAVPAVAQPPRPWSSWLAYAGIGMAAIVLEIAWTRYYSLLLLRTEYVLAIILSVYVAGIGLGGLIGQRLPVRRSLDLMPLLIVFAIAAGLWASLGLAGWIERQSYGSLAAAMLYQGGLLVGLTLPVTLLLGAWLPLLHRLPGAARLAGIELYGFNAIGSAVGALLAGFVLIPLVGTTAAICSAAAALGVFGLHWVERRLATIFAGIAVVAAMLPLWELPAVSRLLPISQAGSKDLYRYEDALATTHVVERGDGERLLLSDLQRMDAASDPASVASQQDQARLPLLLHPAPRSVLFLGLGTGVTASGSLAFPGLERTAVELSRGAIVAASEWFAPVNSRITMQMRIVNDDIRRFLMGDDRRYDVIIGDLFHPDLVGRGSLLSRQEFERVRRRLSPGGLYVQWLALNQFDRENLGLVLRTFARAFPKAMLFIDGFRLALVGSAEDWAGPGSLRDDRGAPGSTPDADRSEDGWTWAGRYWGWPELPPGPVEDEWRPRIEYALPRARYAGAVDLVAMLDWLERVRPPLSESVKQLAIDDGARERFERAYMATSLALRSWKEGLLGHEAAADRLLRFAQQANPGDRWIGWALADRLFETLPEARRHGVDERQALGEILAIMPGHPEALARLLALEVRAGHLARAEALRARLQRITPLGYRHLIGGITP